jgi:hypothetical protein
VAPAAPPSAFEKNKSQTISCPLRPAGIYLQSKSFLEGIMTVFQASPSCLPPRRGKVPHAAEIIESLRYPPYGTWVAVPLSELKGDSPRAKQAATVRSVARYFTPLQSMIEKDMLYIRRLRPGYPEALYRSARFLVARSGVVAPTQTRVLGGAA